MPIRKIFAELKLGNIATGAQEVMIARSTEALEQVTAIENNSEFEFSNNGVYLVRVEPLKDELIITHECPACIQGRECRHIPFAEAIYKRWQWWEPDKQIRESEISTIRRDIE